MKLVDDLLEKNPFDLEQSKKEELFLQSMRASLKYHYDCCEMFRRFSDAKGFNVHSNFILEDIPFLPVSIFKEMELITGNVCEIKKVVKSSSTSGNKPSSISLDSITINRQRKALVSILSSFLGSKKKVFLIFDSKSTILGSKGNISSRASAMRGLLPFAKSHHFLLNDELALDFDNLQESLSKTGNGEVCFFGFTWLMYQTLQKMKINTSQLIQFTKYIEKIEGKKSLLHIGGWKKLQGLSIRKEQFNKEMGSFLQLDNSKIVDFYGMTEQLGTVYPDCEFGYKHAPLYSEVIMRNPKTFEPCRIGETGFIQLLSPLPNSYPGISIITEDLGKLIGIDDCECGRKGKYFVFEKRAEKAEIKGCGDTLD